MKPAVKRKKIIESPEARRREELKRKISKYAGKNPKETARLIKTWFLEDKK